MKFPKKVMVFGGTHGNEWTGVMIVKHYQQYFQTRYPELEIEFHLANLEAYELNHRYKDEDLNRAFQYLNEDKKSYENARARELKALIDEKVCVVIDLHTTTSNMGNTIILSHLNQQNIGLSAYLLDKIENCRVLSAPDPQKKYLVSQSEFGLMVELGPVANGTIHPKHLENGLAILESIFAYLSQPTEPIKEEITLYEEVKDIYYPKSLTGEINGYIHSDLQGKDYLPLKGKIKAFKLFQHDEIELELDEELYPIFINEAAYYSTHLAFSLCRKKTIKTGAPCKY